MSDAASQLPEIAFYYPNPYWRDSDWAKTLVLFFDGIATLVPNYMPPHGDMDGEAIIEGLREHKLFHVLEPETFVDKGAAEGLAVAMTDVIASGALDTLSIPEGLRFQEISMSRMGFHVAEDLAKMIFDELKQRGLAKDTEDGVSIPLHPKVRSLFLVLLAQLLRPNGRKLGFDLSPATDSPEVVSTLADLLAQPQMPSSGHVVSFDLAAVGVDLGGVPMDEILSFRLENLALHRKYARNLKIFTHELSMAPELESDLFEERQKELDQIAAEIRRVSRRAWKKPATFLLSCAGSFWKFVAGDPVMGVIAAAAALLSLGGTESVDAGAYAFLFQAKRRFPY
jgi:hypothetical protein